MASNVSRLRGEMGTADTSYAERLLRYEQVWWKRLLDVQRPYRLHLQRLHLGFVLEIGCGLGRNLAALGPNAAVGVDHNERAVEVARSRGLLAFSPADFRRSEYAAADRFDALLLSHVLEHMSEHEATELIQNHASYLRPGGRLVVITPQEVGFRSDPTHVTMMDFDRVATIIERARFETVRQYSFPFPRIVGRVFKYNEFGSIARTPAPLHPGRPEEGK